MIEDREILHNGVTYSISTLYDLVDLLTEEKALREKVSAVYSNPDDYYVKKKEYDELVKDIDDFVLSCSTMIIIYSDLFGIPLDATRKDR